jgi:pyruvate dehydrogenase complex dehydrogenase (E1) component
LGSSSYWLTGLSANQLFSLSAFSFIRLPAYQLISLNTELYDWFGFKKSAEICAICGKQRGRVFILGS